jgi:hypothetical protein
MKKWINRHPISMMLIGSLLFCIILTLWGVRLWGSSFIQDFGANWLATFLGVAIGVPLALWVNRYQEKITEGERKRKILSLLTTELLMNFGTLTGWNKENNIMVRSTNLIVFLESGFWDAFSDGGELQWIKDPVLLSKIAEAYNFIRMILELSNRYFEILKVPHFDQGKTAIKHTLYLLEKGVPNAMAEISTALKAIEDADKQ